MHEAVGRTQTLQDVMDPDRTRALLAVLGRDWPDEGLILPPFAHQAYFWNIADRYDLGSDGHPALGDFIPDLGLPIRMWAGGRLNFHAPLKAGTPAVKSSTIDSIESKQGRSGPLAFVTIRHDIVQAGQTCVTEWQDLVYRASSGEGRGTECPIGADVVTEEVYDARILFRYSAITFNAHRIHYDQSFCKDELGLSDVVVHGPLLAQYLMLLAQDHLGHLRSFEFRATAPLTAGTRARFCWRDDGQMWVEGIDGKVHMTATAG